jgi:hypothetical protein
MSDKLIKQGYDQFENRMSRSDVVPHEDGDVGSDVANVTLVRAGEGSTLCVRILGRENDINDGDCIYAGDESRFFVQGEMDAVETGAVTQLLQWIDSVTDRFFSEEIQNSFKKAVSLGFDGRQLACYSQDELSPANAPMSVTDDSMGIGDISPQGRVNCYAYETDPDVRLGDAIKYTRVLNEIFDFWHGSGLFEKPGQFVTDVAQQLIMKKSVVRDADSRLTGFFSDILVSLGVMFRH